MNKRIRELYDQCIVGRNNDAQWIFEGDLDPEKFADLIVWECMKICEDVMKKNNSALDCWSQIKGTFRS